jgi:hypothetical protein
MEQMELEHHLATAAPPQLDDHLATAKAPLASLVLQPEDVQPHNTVAGLEMELKDPLAEEHEMADVLAQDPPLDPPPPPRRAFGNFFFGFWTT